MYLMMDSPLFDVVGVLVWCVLSGYVSAYVTCCLIMLAKGYSGLGSLTCSPINKSIIKYIQYVHDIISIDPYTKFHIYCRLYMQPQIHTVCTRYYNIK